MLLRNTTANAIIPKRLSTKEHLSEVTKHYK